jgi:peptide/nickel transport system substrate-binding protein
MADAVAIAQLTLVGLAEWDDQGNFVPELAADTPTMANGGISADGLTITWKLKPCLHWSDGEPLTSADVKFTWESVMDPNNAPSSRLGYDKIARIDTPDDTTVVIHFSRLYPSWQTLFTQGPYNWGAILPQHILAGKTHLESDPFIHQPSIASGPWVITEWVPGDHMTLLPNPNFYAGRPKLDRIQIKFMPDSKTVLTALKSGDVDWYPDLYESEFAIETVGALEPAIHLKVVPGADVEQLFFNLGTTKGVEVNGQTVGKSDVDGFCPFQDVNVRKAIMLGIDRLSFIKNYFKEDEKAFIATLWPDSSWTNTSLQPYPYDPDEANQLLNQAGYPKGPDGVRAGDCKMPNGTTKRVKFSLGIETITAQRRVDDVLAIQSDLKKIGIDIKPNHIPAGTFFGSYTEGADMPLGNFDMAIFTSGYYPDPDASSRWDCKDVPSKDNQSGGNDYHLCDPKLDDMWKQGLASVDPAARKKVYDQIQQYMYDNVLMIPLYARTNVYGYADRFVPGSFGFFSGMNWNAEVWDVK